MKKNIKKSENLIEELNEVLEDIKGELLCDTILKIINASKLRGYTIMNALMAIMVDVTYNTAATKMTKGFAKRIANDIHEQFLEGLLNYEELIKEEKEAKTND